MNCIYRGIIPAGVLVLSSNNYHICSPDVSFFFFLHLPFGAPSSYDLQPQPSAYEMWLCPHSFHSQISFWDPADSTGCSPSPSSSSGSANYGCFLSALICGRGFSVQHICSRQPVLGWIYCTVIISKRTKVATYCRCSLFYWTHKNMWQCRKALEKMIRRIIFESISSELAYLIFQ